MLGTKVVSLAIKAVQNTERGTAEVRSFLYYQIENWLRVFNRLADHTQDLSTRCLPCQRLLRFRKEPHVLDGDGRLFGKGLHKVNVCLCRSGSVRPGEDDRAPDRAAGNDGHTHDLSETILLCQFVIAVARVLSIRDTLHRACFNDLA